MQANKTAEKIDTDALTRSAGRGALWQIMGGGWQTFVRLAASTVLARVLDPEDFGLFGMAMLAQALISRVGALGQIPEYTCDEFVNKNSTIHLKSMFSACIDKQ